MHPKFNCVVSCSFTGMHAHSVELNTDWLPPHSVANVHAQQCEHLVLSCSTLVCWQTGTSCVPVIRVAVDHINSIVQYARRSEQGQWGPSSSRPVLGHP